MYETTWIISKENEDGIFPTELTVYHFGKAPKFPSWYMEANNSYVIEMIQNYKLPNPFFTFFKCLTHQYIVK